MNSLPTPLSFVFAALHSQTVNFLTESLVVVLNSLDFAFETRTEVFELPVEIIDADLKLCQNACLRRSAARSNLVDCA